MTRAVKKLRRSRPIRWLMRFVHVLVVLVAAALLVQVTLLPGFVRRVALSQLRQAGLNGASLEVRNVGWWSAELANVALDEEGRARVGSISITYSPASLSRARVRLIEVTGAEVELRVRDGRLDLGPLADIQSVGGGDLPFNTLAVRSSTLLVDVDGRRYRVPIAGSIVDIGAGRCSLDLRAEAEGAHFHLTGTVDTATNDAALELTGEVDDLARPFAAVRSRMGALSAHAGGRIHVKVSIQAEGDDVALTFHARGKGLSCSIAPGVPQLAVGEVSVSLEARLGRPRRVGRLVVSARADRIRVNGHTVQGATLELKREGDALRLSASAEGEGWKLKKLTGVIPGLFGARGEWVADRQRDIAGEVTWEVEGRLPRAFLRQLRRLGIVAEGLGRVAVTGRAKPRWRRGTNGGKESMALEDVHVTLAPGDLALSTAGLVAQGVSADLRLAGAMTPERLELKVLPGSTLQAAKVSFASEELRGRFGTEDEPGVVAQVGGSPAVLSVYRRNGQWTWRASAPELRLGLTGGEASLPADGVGVEGLAADLRMSLSAKPDRLNWKLAAGSRLVVGKVTPHEKLPVKLTQARPDQPALELVLGKEGAEGRVSLDRPGLSYRLKIPEMRLRLSEMSASLPEQIATVEGLSGELVLGAKLKPNEAELDLRKGSWVGFASASAMAGNETVRAAATRLALEEQNGALELVYDGLKQKWAFDLKARTDGAMELTVGEGARVTISSLHASAAASHDVGGMSLRAGLLCSGIAASVKRRVAGRELAATVSDGTLRVGLTGQFAGAKQTVEMDDIPLRVDFALTAGEKGAQLSLADAARKENVAISIGKVEVRGTAGLRAGELTFRGQATAGQGRAEATIGALGKVVLGEVSASLTGSGAMGGAGGLAYEARVGLKIGSASHPQSGLSASGIAFDVPVWRNREAGEAGAFRVASVAYGADRLPGLSGTARLVDGRAELSVAWPLLPGPDAEAPEQDAAKLEAKGWVELGGGVPRGRVRLVVPPFKLGDANQPGDRWRLAKGHEVHGTFGLDGTMAFVGDRVTPRVTFRARDARFANRAWDASAEGVNAAITVTSFAPFATEGGQRIEVREANLGKLRVRNGLVQFRVESPRSILIEQTEWGWAGGHLRTYALRFNPAAPPIDLVVYADRLNLKHVLELIPDGRATGHGILYGRLPVRIGRWPDIRFGQGFLYARPGEKGWVRFKDAAIIGMALEQQDRRFRDHPLYAQVKERIVGGLGDLEFSVFRVDFIHGKDTFGKDRLDARVLIVGQGRTGPRQKFKGIIVNIFDFDQVLKDAILIQRGVRGGIE